MFLYALIELLVILQQFKLSQFYQQDYSEFLLHLISLAHILMVEENCFGSTFLSSPALFPTHQAYEQTPKIHFGIKMEEFDCSGSTEQKHRDVWFEATQAVTLFQVR